MASYVLTADVGHPFYFTVRRLAEEQAVRSVCDFGGGANPVLSLDDIDRLGLDYVVVDASAAVSYTHLTLPTNREV